MNILHVLSGDFMTGSETSTAALAGRQTRAGHKVFIAAGSFSRPGRAQWIRVPIFDRSLVSRLANVRALMRILRAEGIDIVHAHSRAASWVSYWACRLTGTAYLSTLHGRQHLHFTNRRFNVYGPLCTAVCEDIRDQMLKETRVFQPGQIVVIRNGI
jgi:Glycosyltransferase Family 4